MEILLALLLVFGGLWAWRARDRRRRQLATEAVETPLFLPEGGHSLADLFWELGATPLALELLIRRDLLPRDGERGDQARLALRDDLEAFGGWDGLVEDLRDTLIELEEEARAARLHRNLPHLALPEQRLLPGQTADAPPIAIDHGRDPDWMGWLEAVFSGRLDQTIGRWWQGRHLRSARRELDRRLTELAHAVAASVSAEELGRRLHGMVTARQLERDRLEVLEREHAARSSPWALAVEALLRSARERADHDLHQAERSAMRLMDDLHRHLRSGRPEQAGWLLYVNRRLLQDIPGTTLPVALEMVDRAAATLQQRVAEQQGMPREGGR
ncbi:MAG: hypothetical protein EA398_08805 [Deltaproteobacteria bacterium]|nr:MAG: hypothetical protein EA398_08805 [Deltaproteobacteria bacterium]